VCQGVPDPERFSRALCELVNARRWSWKAEDYLGPEPAASLPSGTVAICTRERPDDLTRALHAMQALTVSPADILVIDNNPATERTRLVAALFPRVRYVREDTPGLDAARNRALREAGTPVVAFSDDDATPEPEWLGSLLAGFTDPHVVCVSGLTLPLELETPAQEWFERYSPFGRGFRRRVFDGTRHDPFAVSAVGAGANMALRRDAVLDLGGFDEALDAGTATRSGGDHEMFARILAAGFRIVYEPAAVSWHRHRRTWEELRDTVYGYGVGVYAFWTRKLLFEGELTILRHVVGWLRYGQLPALWRALRRVQSSAPLDLVVAELRGCAAGTGAYLRARHRRARASR